ncbi:MAG TPA: prepilin peptidase [Candidatus Deferrimicrobiaceae bacterium]|jgi:leader peptidase (prepilin peptidase)/N-methyltransferase
MIFVIAAAGVLGLCLGSFFNVLIYRLPLEQSIVSPGSRCPGCGRAIRAWENIPVLSFILLRGRCAGCGVAISWRYPLVELLTGAGFALLAWADLPAGTVIPHDGIAFFPPGALAALLRDLVFFSFLVPIVFIDIDHRIIPDEFSLGGLAAGLALSFLPAGGTGLPGWEGSFGGGLLGGGILYATAWGYERATSREGMGGGDIKLIAMIGAFIGWRGALLTIFGASIAGVAGGMIAMRKGEEGLKTAIPFGPYLCLAALVSRYAGEAFWSFLLR